MFTIPVVSMNRRCGPEALLGGPSPINLVYTGSPRFAIGLSDAQMSTRPPGALSTAALRFRLERFWSSLRVPARRHRWWFGFAGRRTGGRGDTQVNQNRAIGLPVLLHLPPPDFSELDRSIRRAGVILLREVFPPLHSSCDVVAPHPNGGGRWPELHDRVFHVRTRHDQ
jgi:hypothetical protein